MIRRFFPAGFFLLMLGTVCLRVDGQALIAKHDAADLTGNIAGFLNSRDSAFVSNAIPEKWKDKSGVILAQRTVIQVERETLAKRLRLTEWAHYKIWLHDKDAVNNYSTLYFSTNKEENGFSAQILKPDGSVRKIDLSVAIKVEQIGDVPDRFRPYIENGTVVQGLRETGAQIEYYKLAVPDLEAGDILEYARLSRGIIFLKGLDFYEMEPVYYLMNQEFPVVYQGYEFKTQGKCYFSAKSINGAPEFQQSSDGKWDAYRLEDRNRDKVEDIKWVNKYLVLPMAKFQVIYARPGHGASKQLLIGDQEGIRRNVDLQEMALKTRNAYLDMALEIQGGKGTLKNMRSFFKYELEQAKKYQSMDEYPLRVYYVFRHQMLMTQPQGFGSHYFACAFREYLGAKGIPSDLVVTTRNDVTQTKDVLFQEEIEWLVRVKGRFVYPFTISSNLYDASPICQGNDAYIIDVDGTGSPISATIKLPVTAPDDNKMASLIEVALDKDHENLNITATNAYFGISKLSITDAILMHTDAYRKDYKVYGREDEVDMQEFLSLKQIYDQQDKMNAAADKDFIEKPKEMKKWLEEDFKNVISYKSFKLLSDGRNYEDQLLKYKEKYVLGDLVKTAGKNLLVGLPALMGKQTQLSPDEKNRLYDINTKYAKTLRWRVVFDIPAGYTIGDLQDFNVSVDNASGSFTATAKVTDSVLVMDMTKVYKVRNIQKENLDQFRAFLDAAYNYSQKKVLFRKN